MEIIRYEDNDQVDHSGKDSADEIIKNCSCAMIDFLIKIGSGPYFNDVEETKQNKEYKEVKKIVFLNEKPCCRHT